MDAALSSLLEAFISSNDDFGIAYGLVRPLWYDDWMTIEDELRTRELKDRRSKKARSWTIVYATRRCLLGASGIYTVTGWFPNGLLRSLAGKRLGPYRMLG